MLGGLLGAAGGLLGGLFDGDGGVGAANAGNRGLNSWINDLFREMGQREAMHFRDATGLFQDRADQVMGTLDRAEAQVGQGTRESLRGAGDRAQQQTGALTQQLMSSGLSNSSVGANAQRAVANDLERNVSSINAQDGAMRSQLGFGRANLQSNLLGDIANLPLMQNASGQGRLLNWTRALENQAHVPSGQAGGFGALGGALGGFLGGNDAENFGDVWGNITGLFG